MDKTKYEYFAFISYKREDEKWAKWLQHKLEYYKLPVSIRKTDSKLKHGIRPVFKDTTDLEPGPLAKKIQEALDNSKYLIVVCSPLAAKSKWVNKEIQAFVESGRSKRIIPFIIDGIPHSKDPSLECFPQNLNQLADEKELVGANINEMGRDAAAIKTIATMFDLRFDSLWQRHQRARRRRILGLIALSVFALLAALFMTFLYFDRNKAYDSLANKTEELKTAYQTLSDTNTKLKSANDSIITSNDIIRSKTDSLWKSRLETQQEAAMKMMAQDAKENQTLMTAIFNADALLKGGNTLEAVEVAIHQLQSDSKYNYAPRLEYLLRMGLDKLESDSLVLIKRYKPGIQFEGYTSGEDIMFIENGKYIVSYSAGLKVIESITGKIIVDEPFSLDESPGYIAETSEITGFSNDTLYKYNIRTRDLVKAPATFEGKDKYLQVEAMSKDGKRLFTYDADQNTFQIWDMEKMSLIKECPTLHLSDWTINYDGTKYLIKSKEQILEVDLNTKDTQIVRNFYGFDMDYAYSSDGKYIMYKPKNGIELGIINTENRNQHTLYVDSNYFGSYHVSSNGRYLFDGKSVYDLSTGLKTHLSNFNGTLYNGSFSSEGNLLFVLDEDMYLNIYGRVNPKSMYEKIYYPSFPISFGDQYNILFDGENPSWSLEENPRPLNDVSDSDEYDEDDTDFKKHYVFDKSWYVTTGSPITIHDAKTGKIIGKPIYTKSNANGFSISPDKRLIAVYSMYDNSAVYDIASGECILELPFQSIDVGEGDIAFGKDGRLYVMHFDGMEEGHSILVRPFYRYPDIINHAKEVLERYQKIIMPQ